MKARGRWLGAAVALATGLSLPPWSIAARRAAPVEVLPFNIDNFSDDTVASDGRTSSAEWKGGGSLGFISLNRPMDGGPCETNPQPAGPSAPSRQ
jgi:hypothetical protein